MSLDTLKDLLVEQLQDIYYAEKQLVKALPKLAKAATATELQIAFTDHAAQTEEHVARLEQVFEALDVPAKAKKCPAIEGLIAEGAEMMKQEGSAAVRDAGLIASAQRVEHYEVAAYGNLRVFAEALGQDDVVALLDATLADEHAADELLTDIASDTVLPAALTSESESDSDEEDDEADQSPMPARAGKGATGRRAR